MITLLPLVLPVVAAAMMALRLPMGLALASGQSAAKWPIPPQYMQSPCARRRVRSAAVMRVFAAPAERSLGPALVPEAVVLLLVFPPLVFPPLVVSLGVECW